MSDCVLFASLFAAYAVLYTSTAGGPAPADIFNIRFVLAETLILLTSSFTSGLAAVCAERRQKTGTWVFLLATFVLGACFLGLELHEFSGIVAQGFSWQRSAFLSSFFTLVGTHGAHIFAGLAWMAALFLYMAMRGLTPAAVRRIGYFSLFWHFLDIVWIFIFTIVYLIPLL